MSTVKSDENTMTLSSDNYSLDLSMKTSDFASEKQQDKFIKTCKRLVRGSTEYRYWVEYLKDTLSHTSCELTGESSEQTSIDIHHHPICLYAMIKGVVYKYLANHKEFTSFDICEKVLELHYSNKVGYLPLLSNLHEKHHNGFLDLPIELIHGNYQALIEEYTPLWDEDDIEIINDRLSINKSNCHWVNGEYFWKKDGYGDTKREPSGCTSLNI